MITVEKSNGHKVSVFKDRKVMNEHLKELRGTELMDFVNTGINGDHDDMDLMSCYAELKKNK